MLLHTAYAAGWHSPNKIV